MESVDHHFVPIMHQRQFAANKKGEVFVYDKRWQSDPRLKQPRGQGYEKHLYSILRHDGVRSSEVEDEHFKKIDNAAASCLDLNPRDGHKHKPVLAVYAASLVLRNPRLIDSMRLNSEPLMTEMLLRMRSDPEFRRRIRARVSSDEEFEAMMSAIAPGKVSATLTREASMLFNFGVLPSITANIETCEWILMLAPRESHFVLPDVPVFTCDPHSSNRSPAGLGNYRNETSLPLTPHKCLLLRPTDCSKPGGFRVRRASSEVVREINRRSAYASMDRFFASRPDELLKKLAGEFPPRPAEQTAISSEDMVIMPNLVDNNFFSPVWPD